MFGSDGTAIAQNLGIPVDEARETVKNILKGLSGLGTYKIESAKSVEAKGHIVICPETGHKQYWYRYEEWLETKKSFTKSFWDHYRLQKELDPSYRDKRVSKHFKEASEYHRSALNSVTQGLGAVITKRASIMLFDYIVDNNYFNKITFVNITHDEINAEIPEEVAEWFPKFMADTMEEAGKYYCKGLPLTATAAVGDYWIH